MGLRHRCNTLESDPLAKALVHILPLSRGRKNIGENTSKTTTNKTKQAPSQHKHVPTPENDPRHTTGHPPHGRADLQPRAEEVPLQPQQGGDPAARRGVGGGGHRPGGEELLQVLEDVVALRDALGGGAKAPIVARERSDVFGVSRVIGTPMGVALAVCRGHYYPPNTQDDIQTMKTPKAQQIFDCRRHP